MASKHHQTRASIRHRGQSIGPELGGPGGLRRWTRLRWMLRIWRWWGGNFEQHAKLQKAALGLGSDDRISSSACASADLGPAVQGVQ
jgi:hypothetical protein